MIPETENAQDAKSVCPGKSTMLVFSRDGSNVVLYCTSIPHRIFSSVDILSMLKPVSLIHIPNQNTYDSKYYCFSYYEVLEISVSVLVAYDFSYDFSVIQ